MGLVTNITKRLDVPHEQGEWVEIRKLSWRQLEAASDAQTEKAMAKVSGLGAELMASLPKAVAGDRDPVDSYDRGAALAAGIIAWSYDAPVSPDAIGDLDEETAGWLMREIISFTTGDAAERKNG